VVNGSSKRLEDESRLKAFSTKNHSGLLLSGSGVSVAKPLQYLARKVGGLGVSLKAILLLLQVIILVMMWQLHSLRLEVAVVQQQLHLLLAPM
jgi:hypothetical protein